MPSEKQKKPSERVVRLDAGELAFIDIGWVMLLMAAEKRN